MAKTRAAAPDWRQSEEIEKLDNVTWFGHCVIHLAAALRDLPTRDAKVQLIDSLRSFLQGQKQDIGPPQSLVRSTSRLK